MIASVNNQPVRVEDVVEGGRVPDGRSASRAWWSATSRGLGRIGYWKADRQRPPGSPLSWPTWATTKTTWCSASCSMRKGEDTLPALKDVKKKVEEINDPASGRRLPGVEMSPISIART